MSCSDLSSGPLCDPWQGPNFGMSATLHDAWPMNWLKPYSTSHLHTSAWCKSLISFYAHFASLRCCATFKCNDWGEHCLLLYVPSVHLLITCTCCRIQIKSTPFHDCDTPDENFFSSPHFGSHDMLKISSGMAVESHILTTIGVKIIVAVHCWSDN